MQSASRGLGPKLSGRVADTHRSCWVRFPGPRRCSQPQQAELFATASDNVLRGEHREQLHEHSASTLALPATGASPFIPAAIQHRARHKAAGRATKDLPTGAGLHAAFLNGLLTKQVPRTQLRHVALPSRKPPLVLPEGRDSTAAGMQGSQHLFLFLGRSSTCTSGNA